MPFTLVEATIGAVLVGYSSSAMMVFNGKVMGCSGMSNGLISKPFSKDTLWRLSFVFGLLLSSGLLFIGNDQTGAFDTSIRELAWSSAFFAGFLVGFGALLGNGCTSGHSICGISRFSIRSLYYTLVYMAAGFITAAMNNDSKAVADANGDAWPPTWISWENAVTYSSILVFCTVAFIVLYAVSWIPMIKKNQHLSFAFLVFTSGLIGLTFGFGLAIAGMTRPSKVLAFLSITRPEVFDPSLMIVMGLGIGLTVIFYRLAWYVQKVPRFAESFCHTLNTTIDTQLTAGAILFGMGWGMGGVCPGPLIANLVTGEPKVYVLFAGFLVGMAFFNLIKPINCLKKKILREGCSRNNMPVVPDAVAAGTTADLEAQKAPVAEAYEKMSDRVSDRASSSSSLDTDAANPEEPIANPVADAVATPIETEQASPDVAPSAV